jgi:molybdopterin molybdotransferase
MTDGHRSTVDLATARDRWLGLVSAHGRVERVPVSQALGRALAEPVVAERAVPHYARAAMDGFALRAVDVADPPVALEVTTDPVSAGQATFVNTGDPIPDGADAVVRVERTRRSDGRVEIQRPVAPGENVAPVGEDVDRGEQLSEVGSRTDAADLSLLQASGHDAVDVFEPPSVSVIPTGEELVSPSAEPGVGELPETNGLAVATLVERWGGTATRREPVGDDPQRLGGALEAERDHDLVVTIGGSSAGDRDIVPDVLRERGSLAVHGIGIKPGHPAGFGRVDETPVLMVPGYPVSALVVAVQLLRPAVAASGGYRVDPHPTTTAVLDTAIEGAGDRRRFVRVTVDDGAAARVDSAGAGVLSSVTRAEGWVVVPEDHDRLAAGETVDVEHWLWHP